MNSQSFFALKHGNPLFSLVVVFMIDLLGGQGSTLWVAPTLRAFSSPLGCQPAPPETSGTANKKKSTHTCTQGHTKMDHLLPCQEEGGRRGRFMEQRQGVSPVKCPQKARSFPWPRGGLGPRDRSLWPALPASPTLSKVAATSPVLSQVALNVPGRRRGTMRTKSFRTRQEVTSLQLRAINTP